MTEPKRSATCLLLPGRTLPGDFLRFWEQAGSVIETVRDTALRAPGPSPSLTLLWVGSTWEQGLQLLPELPEPVRDRALLLGMDMPPDLVARVRRAGGWAASSWPPSPWVVPAAVHAAGGASPALASVLATSLQKLEPELEHAPESILLRTAELAGQFLGSDLALAILGTAGSFWVINREDAQHGIEVEQWSRVAREKQLAPGLPQLALRERTGTVADRSILAFPTLRHLPEDLRPAATAYPAVVCLPVQSPEGGIAGQPKQLVAAVLLFWARPHLPRMSELLPLKILRAFSASALTRLAERARLTNRHTVAIRAQIEENAPLQQILGAYAGLPGLLEIWVQMIPSPQAGSWISLGAEPACAEPPGARGIEFANTRILPPVGDSGRATLFRFINPDLPELGRLLTIFRSKELALAGKAEMENLAADLELASRLLRREQVDASLAELSSSDIRPAAPRSELLRIAEHVRDCMEADGAKIFVLRLHAGERKNWQICNTERPDDTPGMIRFNPDGPGIANWVLKHKQWLLIPDREQPGAGSEPEKALTASGRVEVVAIPEKEFFRSSTPPDDRERTMLWVPLTSQDRVSGALAVWRNHPHPFNSHLDVESLERFAPHVAAACQRLLQLEKAREELHAAAELAKRLDDASNLASIYKAVVKGAGELADAACALLLHHDQSQPWCLSLSAVWAAESSEGTEKLESLLGRFLVETQEGGSPGNWEAAVCRELEPLVPNLTFRWLWVPSGAVPPLVLVLLDIAHRTERVFFSDALLEHFTHSYLESASALLKTQVDALASWLYDRIGGELTPSERTLEALLRQTAQLLKDATGAEAVLYYAGIGAPSHMKHLGTIPENNQASRFEVLENSETANSLRDRKPRRFLDVTRYASPGLHKDRLAKIAASFGWDAIGSWISCPVVHDQRCYGLIKLLTSDRGPFFGEDHERLAEKVSDRAGLEISKANRSIILSDLVEISSRIAAGGPEQLGTLMVDELQSWMEHRWTRPQAAVAVVATTQDGKPLVLSSSDGLSHEELKQLGTWSEERGATRVVWSPQVAGVPGAAVPSLPSVPYRCGLAEPFQNPGAKLKGHLILLDNQPFEREDQDAWRLAAADMMVLLNGERERQEEREKMGRFRHAALGPIQELTSAAKRLAKLSSDAGVKSPMLGKLQARIEAEAEQLRLWREHQRFYANREVELRPQWQLLRPVVDRCVERFRTILSDRNIQLDYNWQAPPDLRVHFDGPAIDLVLSNLLDNAGKYAFYNREVEVGVRAPGSDRVIIWVEDIGHGIPPDHKNEIYEYGKRALGRDPLRPIPGEGLRLAMCKAIVEAHRGRIFHASKAESQRSRDDVTTPFRVRFTVTLPRHSAGEPGT